MTGTIFRDLVMLMVLGFVAMVVWMLPWLNPVAKDANTDPPGNVIVHITWPPGNVDVDLWVYGPGEAAPVGYSNKGGLLWNLLRDDLGTLDATPLNYENAYTRGIIAGEYTINVHCYRCAVFPVPVDIEVSLSSDTSGKTVLKPIATTRVDLAFNGEEVTALRFRLTGDGELVPGSVNHIFKPLRAQGGEGPLQ